jgi:hypothetical protein
VYVFNGVGDREQQTESINNRSREPPDTHVSIAPDMGVGGQNSKIFDPDVHMVPEAYNQPWGFTGSPHADQLNLLWKDRVITCDDAVRGAGNRAPNTTKTDRFTTIFDS